MADLESERGPGPDAGPDAGPDPGSDPGSDTEPDYRFTLANERTFLAYLRTALALDAGAAAAVQFLSPDRGAWIVRLLGVVLAVAGTVIAAGAFVRWRSNLAAMRRGAALPVTRMPTGLAIAVLFVSLGAVALVLLDR